MTETVPDRGVLICRILHQDAMRHSACLGAIALVLAATGGLKARAADFPVRPVRLVVPSTPGGALDIIARVISPALMEKWGQQIVVDDRAGAGGIIGTEIVARSAPDGHTLLIVAPGFATNPFLVKNLPYDTANDFTPVILVAVSANALVAHPSLPVHTVRELIALAKEKPGQLNYASSGTGSTGHLCMELLKRMTGISLVHVPYKGAGAATASVVAGQTPLLFTAVGAVIPHVRANRLRALGVAGAKRSGAMPEVPTIAEAGVVGYAVDNWYAVVGPRNIPAATTGRINRDILDVLKMPDISSRIAALGFEAAGLSPQETGNYISREMKTWRTVINEAAIQAD
jgi:tripartite-type tricarboxylate transporter receptor subunit TctC